MAPSAKESVIEDDQYFRVIINERSVDDISLDLFYKPHTITLLITCISGLLYFAFTRNEDSPEQNIWNGLSCVLFFFLIISVLAFPNGPFTRPHPAIWRIVFGLSVFYFMLLLFVLFQTHTDIRRMMVWLYPDLRDSGPDLKEYAVNCSDLSFQRLWNSLDVFILCHFFGWVTKALLIRHYGILWTISVMWEITEVAFAHLLPNFAECWWDSILLDIFLCNGLGIWLGMWLCRKLEMRDYHWESIKDIHTATGKLRRAVLQFTPVSWLYVRWLDPNSTTMRILAVWILIVAWQMVELNTFFLKHIFYLQPSHMLNLIRLLLICSISAPTIRQYYVFVTDTRCKRVGTQLWVFCAIMLTESIICIKFGLQMFRQTEVSYIVIWLAVQMISSFVCIYLCAMFAERWNKWKHFGDADSPIRSMKYNATPTPSPFVTADRGKTTKGGSGRRDDEEEEDEVMVVDTHAKDVVTNHSAKNHSRRSNGDKKVADVDAGDKDGVILTRLEDLPKTSRRRRNNAPQPYEGGGGGGEGKTTAAAGAGNTGNKSHKKAAAPPAGRGGGASNVDGAGFPAGSVSAQVESLMSGELLVNGYHRGDATTATNTSSGSGSSKKQEGSDRRKARNSQGDSVGVRTRAGVNGRV